jgi:GT2 family glycosyltransferase
MKLSVCIPTYSPEATLAATIDSLICQKEKIDQLVIVIDNKKHAGYKETLENKYSGIFNLTAHVQPNTGRAGARNKCAQLATGDVLLFLDDDMLTSPDLVSKHLAYHEKGNKVVVGNGYRDETKARNDFAKYLVAVDKIWQRGIPEKCEVTYQAFVFTACNMSISKAVFEQFNGFDARLKDSEDFDLGMRLLEGGMRIMYDRTLLAWPSDWPDIRGFISRHNSYAAGKKELVKLHPEYLKHFPGLLPSPASILKKMILRMIKVTICKAVLNDSFIFRALPLGNKFTLYRLTVAVYSDTNR